MPFDSYGFILFFLPICLAVYAFLAHRPGRRAAFLWLILASLVYYGIWNPIYPLLLSGSIAANHFIGSRLVQGGTDATKKIMVTIGVCCNLAILAYLKYSNFLIDNLNSILDFNISAAQTLLPLALSFITFQQISFLVDSYRGQTTPQPFLDYFLFVAFFPKLTAGPITTHAEFFPQLKTAHLGRIHPTNLAVGFSIFVLGLFKKVILAGQAARYADPVFAAAGGGVACSFFEAWGGVIAYTFQIYFDFSGYSDMAIGIARMFGFLLPENFNSPYKASSVIDFWRRWHISLSNFLKNYIYIPLGGNRRGPLRKYSNLLATMLLAGLWHGAGWSFVIWGGLHGLFLVVNHLWRTYQDNGGRRFAAFINRSGRIWTMTAVSVAWVFFRAEDLPAAWRLTESLGGLHGFALPYKFLEKLNGIGELGGVLEGIGLRFTSYNDLLESGQLAALLVMFLLVRYGPNAQQLFLDHRPCLNPTAAPLPNTFSFLQWRPAAAHGVWVFACFIAAFLYLHKVKEFIYFKF